jgi:hypothetical protein
MNALPSLVVLPLVFLASPVLAQDMDSGPKQGDKVPPLKVFGATGPRKGDEVDYAAERGEKLTVYVFIRVDRWDRPMARFLKTLDDAVQKEGEDSYVVAVWLTDDVTKTKDYLPVAQQSLQFQGTALTCFTGEGAGPKGWGINADAHLTAVVASGGKVAKAWGYQSVNETDVPAVREVLRKAQKGK